jgi:ubiquinol-cytochrome c reductase cytochrome b subunit
MGKFRSWHPAENSGLKVNDMASKIMNWLNKRWPLSAVIKLTLEEQIRGGSSFAYTLGSANIFVFVILAITGVMQLFYYVPTTDHAYDSLMYLELQVPFGWLMHGLHYWAAQAFIVLVALHVARVFIWAAYKEPRQLTWLAGVILLLLVTAMSFTGPLLAWDQLGYWAAQVGISIAGTVPLIGDFIGRFLRGGDAMGQAALSRFFILHIAILPSLLFLVMAIHVIAFRNFGSVGPWNPEKSRRIGWFWPNQILKDTLVAAAILAILVALSVLWPAPITGPADPFDRTLTPKPEWNFLFLYQMLKAFEGSLEPVGTVGIPLVLIFLLLFLPFYDRNPQMNPRKRPYAITIGSILVILIVLFTILGYLSNPVGPPAPAIFQTAQISPAAKEAGPGPAASLIGSWEHGEVLFASYCQSCHGPQGTDKIPNPGSKDGTVPSLNPIDPALFNKDPLTFAKNIDSFIQHGSTPEGDQPAIVMPNFGDKNNLTQQQISGVEAYILHLNRVNRAQILQPGLAPYDFFLLTVIGFAAVCAVTIILWRRSPQETSLVEPPQSSPQPQIETRQQTPPPAPGEPPVKPPLLFAIVVIIVVAIVASALTLIFSQFVTVK